MKLFDAFLAALGFIVIVGFVAVIAVACGVTIATMPGGCS